MSLTSFLHLKYVEKYPYPDNVLNDGWICKPFIEIHTF